MNKPEKLAYQFRVTHGISDFPITYRRLLEIMKERGYKVRKYSESQEELKENNLLQYTEMFKAFSIVVNGIISVYIRDDIREDEEIPVAGHELGHIVLGDLLEREKTPEQEAAADEFTAYFLAPPCYLDKIGIKTLEELETMLPYNHKLCKEIWANLTAWQQRHKPMVYEEECVCKVMRASPQSNPTNSEYSKNEIDIAQQVPAQNKNTKILLTGMGIVLAVCICVICFLSGKLIGSNGAANYISQPSEDYYTSSQQSGQPAAESSAPVQSESRIVSSVEDEGTLVYVTTTGDKYHKWGCQYINSKTNLLDMYLSEAQSKGYTPCSKCFK